MTRPQTDVDAYRLKKLGVQVQADRDAANRQRDRALRPRLDEIRDEGFSVGETIGAIDFVGAGVSVNRVGEVATVTVPASVYVAENSVTGATTGSNASTVTYVSALDFAFTLPEGTWTVCLQGSMLATHSATGTVDLRIDLDSTLGTLKSPSAIPTTAGLRIQNSDTFTVQAAGSHTAHVSYKANTAGTVAARNASILVIGMRTT